MSYRYVGSELELFSAATNWKTYMASVLSRFIGGRVLEVGAGIGSNIIYLHTALSANGRAPTPMVISPVASMIESRQASCRRPAV